MVVFELSFFCFIFSWFRILLKKTENIHFGKNSSRFVVTCFVSSHKLLLRSLLLSRSTRNNGYHYYYYDDDDDDENDFVKVQTTTTKTKDEIFGPGGINLPIEKKTTRHHSGERVRGSGIRGRDGRVLRSDAAETS